MWRRTTSLISALALGAAGAGIVSMPAQASGPDANHVEASGAAGLMLQSDVAASEITSYEVTDSEFTWGVRESFRSYIRGPIANGSVESNGPAVADDSGVLTWSVGTGTIDSDQPLKGSVSFDGGVNYRGHAGDQYDGGFGLNVDLTNPTISFEETEDGVTGTLYLDAFANSYNGSGGMDEKQVAFANLNFSDDFAIEDDQITGTAEATMHEDGTAAFIGLYEAGEELDPLTFSATVTPVEDLQDGEEPTEAPSDQPTEEPSEERIVEPSLTVDPSTDINPNGETITVTGEGFGTEAEAPVYAPGDHAGFYAQVGWINESWRPSEGAGSDARSNSYSVWVQDAEADSPYLQWSENEDGTADFTWEIEIDQETLEETRRDEAELAVFTIGAGGVTQEENEVAVALDFADEPGSEETDGTQEPLERPDSEEAESIQEPTAEPDPSDDSSNEPTNGSTSAPTDELTNDAGNESINAAGNQPEGDDSGSDGLTDDNAHEADLVAREDTGSTGGLANTGAEVATIVGAGIILLLAGGTIIAATRKRRAH